MAERETPVTRPSVPEADRLIGVKFPVLAHGYVVLIDYMGNDAAIVQAARVSYGQGTKSVRDDRGLVRYLLRHRHTTPFEMVEFKFLVRLPIYVARQWIRHRTACLAEGTRVQLDAARGTLQRKAGSASRSIENLWRRRLASHRIPSVALRHLNEADQRFDRTPLVEVYQNGVREVVRVTLSDGKTVECTPDHRFLFAGGWSTLREAMGVTVANKRATWQPGDYRLATNGEVRDVPDTARGSEPPLRSLARSQGKPHPEVSRHRWVAPKFVRVAQVEYVGPRMTYDLEVAGPHHNFVANGIVTHNSVNEYSARYSIVPDEFDLPPLSEIRAQSTRNRQGRGGELPAGVPEAFRTDLDRVSREAYRVYREALDKGVARETARMVLPLAYYTEWYWKINLHNLFHFLSLRLDAHSQDEIRLYAAELAKLGRTVCPVAFEAFDEFSLGGLTFSRHERRALAALLDGKSPEEACRLAELPLVRPDGKPMTSGEGVEFLEKLERIRRVD